MRELLQQALEYVTDIYNDSLEYGIDYVDKEIKLIAALRQAIEQAEKQEPVAWDKTNDQVCSLLRMAHDILACASFPPLKEWVGLTAQEIEDIQKNNISMMGINYLDRICQAVEAKLKEKNT